MKILFIGNSQMYSYDLPQMVQILSESAPVDYPRIEIGRVTVGGATLKTHWDAGDGPGTPRGLIAGERWDWVVLQEIFNATQPDFETYAARFDDAIRKSSAQTILFATANVTQHYNAAFRYPDSFRSLNDMQIEFGRKANIRVAAAGYAWMKYLGPHPSEEQILDLYHADKGHPGPKGTYLYACLLYAVMTGKNPAGLVREFKEIQGGIVIGKEEAEKMQSVAWEMRVPVEGVALDEIDVADGAGYSTATQNKNITTDGTDHTDAATRK
jgi:hypothetical protein